MRAKGQTGLKFPGMGARIEACVRAAGFKTLADFAREKKIDKGVVYKWGVETIPSDEHMAMLVRELGVPMGYFLLGVEGAQAVVTWAEEHGVEAAPLKATPPKPTPSAPKAPGPDGQQTPSLDAERARRAARKVSGNPRPTGPRGGAGGQGRR